MAERSATPTGDSCSAAMLYVTSRTMHLADVQVQTDRIRQSLRLFSMHCVGLKGDTKLCDACVGPGSSLELGRLPSPLKLGMQDFQDSKEAQTRPDIELLQTDLRALVMAASRSSSRESAIFSSLTCVQLDLSGVGGAHAVSRMS